MVMILKFKYKILIISLVLILTLSISMVSANENTSDMKSIVEQDTSTVSINNTMVDNVANTQNTNDDGGVNDALQSNEDSSNIDKLSNTKQQSLGANFDDLQTEINNHYGSTLDLTRDYIFDSGDYIYITDGITINGNGHILDGNNSQNIFKISTTSDVVIKNCIFKNAQYYELDSWGNPMYRDGGAINIESSRDVVLENCSFENIRGGEGGAVYIGNANVILLNCNFKNSTSSNDGGSIYIESNNQITLINCSFSDYSGSTGGAIYSNGEMYLLNCSFTNASVYNGGVGLYNYNGIARVINCTFANLRTEYSGGGIASGSELYVYGCTFLNLYAQGEYSGGGAIYAGGCHANISSCIFENVTSGQGGNALYLYYANITVSDCNFTNTIAENLQLIDGYDCEEVNLIGCNFENNVAEDGAIRVFRSEKVNVFNCTMVNMTSTYGGNCYSIHIDDNDEASLGGNIFDNYILLEDTNLKSQMNIVLLNNATVRANRGDYVNIFGSFGDDKGNVIKIVPNEPSKNNINYFVIDDSINVPLNHYDSDTGIYYGDSYSFTDAGIHKISANYISSSSNIDFLTGSVSIPLTFYDLQQEIINTNPGEVLNLRYDYSYNGSGDTDPIIIDKPIIINCNNHIVDAQTAPYIFRINTAGTVVINDCVMEDIAYEYYAFDTNSILYVENGNVNLVNCSFKDATSDGGGFVHVEPGNVVSFSDCSFTDLSGAYVFVNNGGIVSLSDCNFVKTIGEWGYIFDNQGNLTLSNSNIKDISDGSAFSNYGNLTLINSTFSNFTQSNVINNNDNQNIILYNCTFENISNYANGGAIYNSAGNLILALCTFKNISANDGGAIYSYGGDIQAYNCNFSDISAGTGGAIYIQNGDNNIINCNFKNLESYACAIYIEYSNFNLTNCYFENTTSTGGRSGTLYVYNCNFIISNSTIINSSSYYGGFILMEYGEGLISNCKIINSKCDEADYDICVRETAVISFNNNTLDNNIFYEGVDGSKILSEVHIIVLNNSTVFAKKYDNVDFKAIITDDNNNIIMSGNLLSNFTVNTKTKISVPYNAFDWTTGIYTVSYSFSNGGIHTIGGDPNNYINNVSVLTGTVVVPGNFRELQNLIWDNPTGEALNLTYDFYYDGPSDLDHIEIDDKIIINGNNHIIDGRNGAQIFRINNANAVINDCNIINAVDNYGIYIEDAYVYLSNNNIDKYIYLVDNNINSKTYLRFLNSSIHGNKNTDINITAIITDDNDNIIITPNSLFDEFILSNGAHISANYNSNTGAYWAVYSFADEGVYKVDCSYSGSTLLPNITSYPGFIIIGDIDVYTNIDVTINPVTYPSNVSVLINVYALADGIVNITVDNKSFITTVSNGKANVNLTGLSAGNKNALIQFTSIDGFNNDTSINYQFTISKATPQFIITNNSFDLIIESNYAVGDVIIVVNNQEQTLTFDNNHRIVWPGILTYGDNYIFIYYPGNENLTSVLTHEMINIPKLDSGLAITNPANNSVYYVGETFAITITNNTAVNVTVNGEKYNVVNGNVVITTNKLPVGEYTITVFNRENEIYAGNSISHKFTIIKNNAIIENIIVPSSDVPVGQNAVITVTMGNVTSGNVLIEIGEQNYTVPINSQGIATLTVKLDKGTYKPIVYFLGNENYTATNKTSDNEFNVVDSQSDVNITINAPGVIEIDNDLIFTITNTTPVIVTINNKTITPVNGNYIFHADAAGNYTIIARSVNGIGFNTTTFNVFKHIATVDIKGITNGATYTAGSVFYISALTNSDAQGMIISVNDKICPTINNTPINLDSRSLTEGHYVVNVIIYETSKYTATADTKEFYIAKNNATLTINGVENITYAVDTVFKINATTNSTGNVIITVNGKLYTANTEFIGVAGHYIVTATVIENNNFTGKSETIEFSVVKHNAVINSVTVPTADIKEGENAVITVTMGNVTSGTILIGIGEQNYTVPINSQGIATLTVSLPKGTYHATAYYLGDDNYNPATKVNETTFNVFNGDVKPGVIVIIDDVDYPNSPVAIVTTPDKVNGTVIVRIDGKEFEDNLTDGFASITLSGLTAGNKQAVVKVITNKTSYEDVIEKFIINRANSTISLSNNGRTVIATVNVGATGNVVFYINGEEYDIELIGNKAVLDNVLSMGNNAVVAMYKGDVNYTDSSASDSFVVGSKLTPEISIIVINAKVGQIPKFDISVFNGLVAGEGTVNVTFMNVTRTAKLVDGKALVEFGNVLSKGTYTVNVVYSGDFKFEPASNNKTFRLGGKSSSDLQKLVDEAIRNNQTELILTEDYEYNETSVPVIVNSSLIINGNGHIIDGSGNCGIFNITGDNVTLKNMMLTNGNASNGGAVNWIGNDGLISNIVFNDNNATNGGSLYIEGLNVTVKGSDFLNNAADKGGAIYINGNTSAIIETSFINNAAKIGGAIYIEGNNSKLDKTILNNNTAEIGGAIYISGQNITVTNSSIINNTASDLTNVIALDYGSVYVDDYTIANSDKPAVRRVTTLTVLSVDVNGFDVAINTKVQSGAVVNNGLVYLTLNGTTYSALVNNSLATIKLNNLAIGTYDLMVYYINASEYGLSSTNVSFKVNVTGVSKIIVNNINMYYLENAAYIVTAYDLNGLPAVNATVTVNIGGNIINVTTDKDGKASIPLNRYAPNTYKVTASSGSINASSTVVINHIIEAKNTSKVKKSAKKTIIKITVKGEKIRQTQKVKFKYTGGKKVKIKMDKELKKQVVSVNFKGVVSSVKLNKKGVGKLKLNKKQLKKLKKGKKYKATVTFNGRKLYKKVVLNVKFNGKTYKVKTNKKALGKFKVKKKMVKKLKKGKTVPYTITYMGDTVQKFVKIKK